MTRAPLSGNGLSQEMARRTGDVSNTTKHTTTAHLCSTGSVFNTTKHRTTAHLCSTGSVSNTTKHSTTSTSLSSLAPLVQALSLPPPQQSTVPQYTYNSPGSSIDHYKKSTINTSFVFPTSLDTTGSYLSPPYSNKC